MAAFIARNAIATSDQSSRFINAQFDLHNRAMAIQAKIDAIKRGDLPATRTSKPISQDKRIWERNTQRGAITVTAKATLHKGIKPDSKTTIKRWRHEERELAKPIDWHNE